MRTSLAQTSGRRRVRRSRLHAIASRLADPSASRRRHPRRPGEEGFLLIEVIVSALIVALIVIATFNGFDVANKATADSRFRDQATLLAAQSQEQLRSEPASALDALESSPHSYTKTQGGTTYTVLQEAQPLGSSGSTTGCNVSQKTAQTGANFQITSTVTWPIQVKSKRPGVKQVGIVTPPTGSAIEVDVVDGNGVGQPNVTAKATFIPVESGSYATVEGTTNANGCVVLTGLQTTKATVEIVEKTGFVTPSGALKPTPKELTIAPNLTTHDEVLYAEGARVAAHFTYKGASSYEGKEVKGDTFVASNSKLEGEPHYEIGSTGSPICEGAEELYKQPTGTWLSTGYAPVCSKYPTGDLFAFSSPYLVYAGDCEANKATEGEASVTLADGRTTSVEVPLSYTMPTIWTGGSSASKGAATTEQLGPVKITNSECASAKVPVHGWGFNYVHEQSKTLPEGRLEDPFLPFGKFSLCVYESSAKKTFTTTFTNKTAALQSSQEPQIYLGQRTKEEQTAKKSEYEAEESALNSKITEETGHRTTWESELTTAEKTTKPKYETEISEAKSKKTEAESKLTELKKKYEKGEISKSSYESQKTTWENKKKEAETVETKRPGELKTLTETTIPGLKAKITTATESINTWKGQLTTVQGNKSSYETEVAAENASGVTVEGGKSSC